MALGFGVYCMVYYIRLIITYNIMGGFHLYIARMHSNAILGTVTDGGRAGGYNFPMDGYWTYLIDVGSDLPISFQWEALKGNSWMARVAEKCMDASQLRLPSVKLDPQ